MFQPSKIFILLLALGNFLTFAVTYEIDIDDGINFVKFETNPIDGSLNVENTPSISKKLTNETAIPLKASQQQKQDSKSDFVQVPEKMEKLVELKKTMLNEGEKTEKKKHVFITNINKNVNDFLQADQNLKVVETDKISNNAKDNYEKRVEPQYQPLSRPPSPEPRPQYRPQPSPPYEPVNRRQPMRNMKQMPRMYRNKYENGPRDPRRQMYNQNTVRNKYEHYPSSPRIIRYSDVKRMENEQPVLVFDETKKSFVPMSKSKVHKALVKTTTNANVLKATVESSKSTKSS